MRAAVVGFVALLACSVHGSPVKVQSASDNEQAPFSAESLIQQVKLVQTQAQPSSDRVNSLRAQLASEIQSLDVLDASDRANLPDQVTFYQSQINQTLANLDLAKLKRVTLLDNATRIQSTCQGLDARHANTTAEAERLGAEVAVQDSLLAQEKIKSDQHMASIERDLEILEVVEKQVRGEVSGSAERAGIDSGPLQNQVSTLIDSMQQQVHDARAHAEADWRLTQDRLAHDSQAVRTAFSVANHARETLAADLESCRRQSEAAQAAIQHHDEVVVVELEQGLASQRTDLDQVQIRFDERHSARQERKGFLSGLVQELDRLVATQS